MPEFQCCTVNHDQGEYGRGLVHTNGMGLFRVLFDRGYMDTYYSMSPCHLHCYTTEFEGYYNDRPPPFEHMYHVVEGVDGRRLTYRELTSSSPSSGLRWTQLPPWARLLQSPPCA